MIEHQATHNFTSHIENNAYPGRGLIVGRSEADDAWIKVYFIMGRSPNSRNRRFTIVGNGLGTEPVDLAKVEDPSLIIYDVMLEHEGFFILSNGDQTTTINEFLKQGKSFEEALLTREREPDDPNYTPRISALLDKKAAEKPLKLSILKVDPFNPENTLHIFYHVAAPAPGFGLCLTTYQGDGNPLPSFSGDPLILPLKGEAKTILEKYWKALNQDNKISLAVKVIPDDGTDSSILVKNKYD